MKYVLKNDRLSVDIEDVASTRGNRFDRTGFISQVRMNSGGHTFCVPESLVAGKGTGGIGLCNEFGLTDPVGYDEIGVGQWFPKIGVGNLQRGDLLDYDFARTYRMQPYEIRVDAEDRRIRYDVEPRECGGHAVRLQKTVSLEGDSIFIEYMLSNVGTHTVRTSEYVHNFLGIDGSMLGVDYELTFPDPVIVLSMESAYTAGLLRIANNEVGWMHEPERDFYCTLDGHFQGPYFWQLRHRGSGAGVRESGSFIPAKIVVWGAKHVVSPEVFVELSVEPGASFTWSRKFEFFRE